MEAAGFNIVWGKQTMEKEVSEVHIVVAMKQVPELQQIRFRNREPILDDVPLTFSNIDKSALQAAVQISQAIGGKVTILSAGPESLEDTIKEGLAADADDACLVIDENLTGREGSITASVLASAIRRMNDVSLIIFGEGSADNYSGEIGSRVAEILDCPEVGYAHQIEIKDNSAIVKRSLEDGEEIIQVSLPAVITVVAEICTPPIPSVTKVLKAGKKPKQIIRLDDLDIQPMTESSIRLVSNLIPETSRKHVTVTTVEELAAIIRQVG